MTKDELALKNFFKLLSDENKFKIISKLKTGEKCVCIIYKELDLDQTLVSHHLSALKKAGFINARKHGRWVHYSINKEAFKEIENIFDSLFGIKNLKESKIKIIFLCTGNSARSQMAEGFANSLRENVYKDSDLSIFSAGISPKPVNPLSIKVMAEKNIDLSLYKSKSINDIDLTNADYIITLCGDARDNCPYVAAKTKNLHWNLLDPANAEGSEEEKLNFFRNIRNNIEIKVKDFLKSIAK